MLIKRIVYDGKNVIKNNDLILCEVINDEGESVMKFISEIHLQSIGLMPCSSSISIENTSDEINKEKNKDSGENNFSYKWDEKSTKYLLDQYIIYFPQIGPFRAFKNKAAMFEQISKDLFQQFNKTITKEQCINRFKNVNRQKKTALLHNQVSGNTFNDVPYEDEFEKIKDLDDSLKPDVLVGVNHIKFNEKTNKKDMNDSDENSIKSDESNDKFESPKPRTKRLKSNNMDQVLREIAVTAEVNRERRHKEKCDLLLSLFGKKGQD